MPYYLCHAWQLQAAVAIDSAADTSTTIDQGIGNVTSATDGQGVGGTVFSSGSSVDTTYILAAEWLNGTSAASVTVNVTDQPYHWF